MGIKVAITDWGVGCWLKPKRREGSERESWTRILHTTPSTQYFAGMIQIANGIINHAVFKSSVDFI